MSSLLVWCVKYSGVNSCKFATVCIVIKTFFITEKEVHQFRFETKKAAFMSFIYSMITQTYWGNLQHILPVEDMNT